MFNTTSMSFGQTRTRGNIFASYEADKVVKVLSGAYHDEERKAYFEGMGISLENVHSMESALKISGLDFEVKKVPVFHGGLDDEYSFTQIPETFATVRSDTHQTLGIVGEGYQILQNREAFSFLDSLVAIGDAKFTSAGNFKKNGGASYIQMSTEPVKILDDDFDNYLMISNGHDGGSAVVVVITPVRAWCRNSALLALKNASCKVSVRHTVNMHDNLERAKEVLFASTKYLDALKEVAEELAVKPFSEEAFEHLAYKLYPVRESASDTTQIRNLAFVEQLLQAYKADDLQNFNGSAWKALQAVSDAESHKIQFRKMSKLADNGTPNFQAVVINGMPLLNKAFQIIKEAV